MVAWDFVEALRARWRLIGAVTLAVLAAVSVWSLMSARQYTATATLLFNAGQADPVNPNEAGAKDAALGTQADIIRSAYVAQRVVTNLHIDQDPNVIQRYEAAKTSVPLVDWLARRLTSPAALQILPTGNTSVLAVNYVGNDPDFVSLMANGFASAYVQTQLQLKIDPARVYSQWFESRIRDVRQRLEAAQARLTGFQRQNGLIGAGKYDVETTRLAELSSQLTSAEGQAAEANAQATSSVGSSAGAQMSGLVQSLDGQIAGKSAQLQQLRQAYGANHPTLIAAEVELAELRKERSQAVGTAISAVRVTSQAAQAREGDLRNRVAEQRARVLKLSSVQDQMAVLQRDVDAAQADYQAITQRLNQVRLQSEIPQTNVSLLDHAVPPTFPSSPNVPMRLVLGLLVGLMAGAGIALALEWFDPRVRTIAGTEGGTQVPVLADLSQRHSILILPGSGKSV